MKCNLLNYYIIFLEFISFHRIIDIYLAVQSLRSFFFISF